MSFKSVGIAHRIPIRMTTMPLIVALIMAFAVRLMARGDHLSSDEIYGATFANLGLWDVVIGSLRFDLHPPLYYLQIAVWALPSTADSWLLLNSLIWNLIALIGLYVAARRVFSESVAVTAALLFAVMPMSIQYANQLRMYALMMALAVAAWYALERLASDSDDQRLGALAVLAELGIVYSHATGFLMIVGFPVYMALRVLAGDPARRWPRLRQGIVIHTVIAAASLPALGNTLVRSVSHTTAPDAATVWMTLQTLIVGPAAAVALPLMVMVSMVLIAGSILDRRVRALVAACVITPPAVLLILSYGLRPAWHIRSLVFATPLIALALAAAVGAIADRLRALPRHGSTVTVLVLALLSIGFAIQAGQHVDRVRKTEDYPGLVAFLANRHQSGDAVLITDKVLFWGVARLYLGQDWGSPLRIQAGNLPERWAAIRDRLGPLWWRRLGLEAEGHVASKGHRQLLVGWDALPDAARSNRVWVIQPPPANTAPLSRLGLTAVEHHNFDGLLMTLWKH